MIWVARYTGNTMQPILITKYRIILSEAANNTFWDSECIFAILVKMDQMDLSSQLSKPS